MPPPPDVRLRIAPYDYAAAERLCAVLDVSHVTAQVLVRRGFGDPAQARAFLAAEARHPLDAFGGLREGAARILEHVGRGSRITVHGDYDVDGVSATAVLVRALRTLGADVDWYLPSRIDDGYGLAMATVERLAARGTDLLVTVDCAITAVDEVAAARAAGVDVVVTDHHAPRADGRLPDAPIVHPQIGGYPCPELCAAGVAHLLARALLEAAGMDPGAADADLDVVALATVADCVPLVGENRRLVRAGLRALASTRKPGLQALMEVARVDPSGVDAGAIGFRLAPRINAAGRLHRADAGLELLLTADVARARAVAAELDAVNVERRDVETRILFEAEAQVAAARSAGPEPAAYVLAADGWHPGVIGIVASRIAERHHRPAVLDRPGRRRGHGLGALHPGVRPARRPRRRERRPAPPWRAPRRRGPDDRARPRRRVPRGVRDPRRRDADPRGPDARPADRRRRPRRRAAPRPGGGAAAARALRDGQPRPRAAGAERAARRPAADGGGAARLVLAGGGRRAVALRRVRTRQQPPRRARRAGRRGRAAGGESLQRRGRAAARAPPRAAGPPGADPRSSASRPSKRRCWPSSSATSTRGRPATACPPRSLDDLRGAADGLGGVERRAVRDARGSGIAGLLGDLVASGAAVLAVTAHAGQRAVALRDRVGGFAVTTWGAVETEPELARGYPHVVAVDPPSHAHLRALAEGLPGDGWTHLAWGGAELELARRVLAWELDLRPQLAELYRALRTAAAPEGSPAALGRERLFAVLGGSGPQPRSGRLAGRLLRVLDELGLVEFRRAEFSIAVPPAAGRTELERSPAFRAYAARLREGIAYLSEPPRTARRGAAGGRRRLIRSGP